MPWSWCLWRVRKLSDFIKKIPKGSYDAISVLFSLWSVTSWLWIDKIPGVTKTKVSKPKRYSLSKIRLCHALLKRLIQTRPTCLCHDVGWFPKHCPNVYTKKEGVTIIVAVVLCAAAGTMSWRRCVSLWNFICASKRGHNYKSEVKLYLQLWSDQPKY